MGCFSDLDMSLKWLIWKKISFRSTQFQLNSFRYAFERKYLDQISADIYFSFVFFSSIPNYLMFGVPPLLCFEIILIVFSLLICYQNHLAENNLVHRDLAARNVLVGHDNQIKVSDFGLMRQIYEDVNSSAKSRKLPVKWMAPESLYQGVYTTKSDV